MFIVIFFMWLILCGWLAGSFLDKFFPGGRIINYVIGGGLAIILLSLFANIFTAWFKLDNYSIITAFILTSLALTAGFFYFRNYQSTVTTGREQGNKMSLVAWLLFAFAVIAGFYAVFVAPDASGLYSPWQVLPVWYLLPIFLTVAIIFAAIYFGESAWKIILAIVAFSLLIHSYLLVYNNGFGGDRFRHLASERRLEQELEYQPTLMTSNLWLKKIGPLELPAALIDSAKLSYGAQWSLEVIIAKVSGFDIFQINRFLLPILWSILVPLLFYIIGLLVWNDKRPALLAAVLSNSLYLLQYYGSQGLPASYGVLSFIFAVAFYLAWLRAGSSKILLLAAVFTLLSYFNYSLVFLLSVIFGTSVFFIRQKTILALLAAVIFGGCLLALDAGRPADAFAFSRLSDAWLSGNLLFFFGRISTYLGQWNYVFNLLAVLIFTVGIIYLIMRVWRTKNSAGRALVLIFVLLLITYLAGWVFFSGEHLLVRRLTLFAAIPLVFLLAYAFDLFGKNKKIIPILVVVLALGTVFTYFSGPVLNLSVTNQDLKRAEEIWPTVKGGGNICVQEPLPVILSLEYISAKEFQETINNINCGS